MPSAPAAPAPEMVPLLVTVPPPIRRIPSFISPLMVPELVTTVPVARPTSASASAS